MNKTDEARRVVAGLEEKIATLAAREVAIVDEARRISFDAHAGDEAAKKSLAKLDEQGHRRVRLERLAVLAEAQRLPCP